MAGQLTIGVIGHVDHGKTSLVHALTGMETDRLAEERQRGLSIVPGFAWLNLNDTMVDLIDVPGHEDFVRMMVAGSSGIDAFMLVVDAGEGVKPQTREHLAIACALGVREGIAVLSKCDRVDAQDCTRADTELKQYLDAMGLEHVALVRASASGEPGVEAVLQALARIAHEAGKQKIQGQFHLPVDRVFTMAGHGTVVTGTVRGGELRLDDKLLLMPAGKPVQVRGLQCHGARVSEARRGQRLAINLRGVDLEDVRRGDVLALEGYVTATKQVDVAVRVFTDAAVIPRHAKRVRVLAGTAVVTGRMRVLDQAQLQAGEDALVQISLDDALAVAPRERVVLRSESPVASFAGGVILACDPPRHRRFDEQILSQLRTLSAEDANTRWQAELELAGRVGLDIDTTPGLSTMKGEQLAALCESLDAVIVHEQILIARNTLEKLKLATLQSLDSFHERDAQRRGITADALLETIEPACPSVLMQFLIRDLQVRGEVQVTDGLVHRPEHDPFRALQADERARLEEIETAVRDAWMQPPAPAEVAGSAQDRALLQLLREHGRVQVVQGESAGKQLLWHQAAIEWAVRALQSRYPQGESFTVSDARKALGSTRKYVLPLLVYLDQRGVTRRREANRELTGKPLR